MLASLLPLAMAMAAESAAPAESSGALHMVQQIFGPFGVKPNLLIAQIINFCIVAFVVYRLGVKPVLATVDERNKKIAEGLQYAEDMKKKLAETDRQQAEVLRQASLEGKKIIAEARESGKALVEKAAQDATRTAEDIIKKGHEANTLEHSQMLNELRGQVAQLVVATTNRVLGRDLSPEERSRFAASAAADLSKN